MKIFFPSCICLTTGMLLLAFTVSAQAPAPAVPSQAKGLFASDEVFEITISGNIRELLNDRDKVSQFHHPMKLSYKEEDSSQVSLETEIRTRGHFRKMKEHCVYPPLLIHFLNRDQLKSSIFSEQDSLKLVMPCQGDEYVIHEWLVYKIYNLVTPKSFKARLIRVRLEDAKNKKTSLPFYGMLLEEEQQLAKRNNTQSIKIKIRPEQTDPSSFLIMAVFEYLIGNTDWSVQYLQNIKLLAQNPKASPATVPFDFDLAGIVDAPYAKPAEELEMNSVRERRYRGYCMQDMKKFDSAIDLYNRLKKDIYNVFAECPLISEKYKKSTAKYLDEFYTTINDAKALRKDFEYPCDKNGTGNVVIKGLRED
ncbi:MAG: hypothetical protein ACHQET_09510 [Chitinophagales bacterium]